MKDLRELPEGLKKSLRALFELTIGSEDETIYFGAKRVYERGRGIYGFDESNKLWEKEDDPKKVDDVRLYLETANMLEYVDKVVVVSGINHAIKGYRINPNKIDELELLTEK